MRERTGFPVSYEYSLVDLEDQTYVAVDISFLPVTEGRVSYAMGVRECFKASWRAFTAGLRLMLARLS